jgi:DNA-binding NtrC family response regulator
LKLRTGNNPHYPILIVDDEEHALKSFELTLRTSGFNHIILCSKSPDVFGILEKEEIELMLLDLMMPDLSGEEILTRVVEHFPEIPVIMVTGTNEVETAVRCMKNGAFDYVLKPVEKQRLVPNIQRAIEVSGLRRENSRLTRCFLSDTLEQPEKFLKIITRNRKMRAIFQYCEAIAGGRYPVLISGETGSGKELIAEALHALSGRGGKFVAVNAAGLDDNMFSDTLFGHVKGAFTQAAQLRAGQIERARGGALFLDEIGDLSLNSQVKLLRILDKQEYFPLGSDLAKPADVRFLFATHKDLSQSMKKGLFREDLFYRLRTHSIHIPPLRERMDDIPLLLEHFIDEAAKEFKKKKPTYHQGLVDLLQSQHFPGNVRELRAMVFDAVGRHKSKMLSTKTFRNAIQDRMITPNSSGELPFLTSSTSWLPRLEQLPTLKEATDGLIREALRRSKNNQRVAALSLGITPQALNQRLKKKS